MHDNESTGKVRVPMEQVSPNITSLESMFAPRSVAVVGASRMPGRIGFAAMNKLMTCGFTGTIIGVNPSGGSGPGDVQYVSQLPNLDGGIDLAILCVPAAVVENSLEECGRVNVRTAVIIASDMSESGPAGKLREAQAKAVAENFGMRVLGPNTFGFATSAADGTNVSATYHDLRTARRNGSRVAVVGQGGGMTAYIGSEGLAAAGIFPRLLIDTGNEIDIDLADCVSYISTLPEITAIGIVVESARNGRKLCAAVAQAQQAGIVSVIFRMGRTHAGVKAASLHTGALGSQNAALWDELASLGATVTGDERTALATLVALNQSHRYPRSPRVGILSGSGGFGVHAADLFQEQGVGLAKFDIAPSIEESAALRTEHPANPVDLGGLTQRSGEIGGTDRMTIALDFVLKQPAVDIAVLWQHKVPVGEELSTHLSMLRSLTTAHSKPIFVCGSNSPEFSMAASEVGVGAFQFPSELAIGVAALGKASPTVTGELVVESLVDVNPTESIISHVGKAGVEILGSAVPGVRTETLEGNADVAGVARRLGSPLVLKLQHPDLIHKSEIGGVRIVHSEDHILATREELLTAASRHGYHGATVVAEEFASGFEVAVGATVDPLVGPTVMVGRGGIDIETIKDVTFALAPVDQTRAAEMIGRLRCADLLAGSRSPQPYDLPALITLIVQISEFIATQGHRYPGVDLNPIMLRPVGQGLLAADAVVSEVR
jgi:acyl-CoA synthetase (NDP forming)